MMRLHRSELRHNNTSLSLEEESRLSEERVPSPVEGTDAKHWSASDPAASGRVK